MTPRNDQGTKIVVPGAQQSLCTSLIGQPSHGARRPAQGPRQALAGLASHQLPHIQYFTELPAFACFVQTSRPSRRSSNKLQPWPI